jgi:hypothetical protein
MVDRENVAASIRDQPMWEQGRAWATLREDLIEFECDACCNTADVKEIRDLIAVLLAAAEYAEGGAK